MKKFFNIFFLFFLVFEIKEGIAGSSFERKEAVIHLHSIYSMKGELRPEEIVQTAKETGIDAVIFSDDALVKISYGFIGVEKTSVFRKGVHRYFQEIDTVERKFPGMTVIPGVEVAPFYYWEEPPFLGRGVVRDWNKHLLVFGLDEKSLRSLPFRGNERGWNFFLSRKTSHKGSLKAEDPYQRVIDFVVANGGLIFWAHPEAKIVPKTIGPVTFITDPYPNALKGTKRYTGFAILFEGMKTIGIPGGLWDQLLNEYCLGLRHQPVWAIGELDYTREGHANTWINSVKTVLFCREEGREGVLEAFRQGRMYAVRRSRVKEMILKEYWIGNEKVKGFLGEEIVLFENPKINFTVSFSDHSSQEIHVRVIRNGDVIRELEFQTPVSFHHEDPLDREGRYFYRLEIKGGSEQILLTNPIFVTRRFEEGGRKNGETEK